MSKNHSNRHLFRVNLELDSKLIKSYTKAVNCGECVIIIESSSESENISCFALSIHSNGDKYSIT